MTEKEAYDILYKPKEITYGMNFSEVIKAEEVAKFALEKRIPKKPHEDFTGLFWTCTEIILGYKKGEEKGFQKGYIEGKEEGLKQGRKEGMRFIL